MLIGAIAGFAATVATGSVWIGLVMAACAGMLFGALFAGLVVTLRLNQVVTGLAFTVLGAGISSFFGKSYIGIPAPQTVPKVDLTDAEQCSHPGNLQSECAGVFRHRNDAHCLHLSLAGRGQA